MDLVALLYNFFFFVPLWFCYRNVLFRLKKIGVDNPNDVSTKLDFNLLIFISSSHYQPTIDKVSVCLFGGEIGWMENFREKMGRKFFWSVFGCVGRKNK